METKRCVRCERDLPINKFVHRLVRNRSFVHSSCRKCESKKYRSRLRLEFLNEFGNRCSCCGESHPYFLSLEHIDGHKGHRSTEWQLQLAKRDGWDRTKYEALCFNCNCAKGCYGQCPHRSGVTAKVVYEILERDARNLTESGHRGFTPEDRLKGQQSRRKFTYDQAQEIRAMHAAGSSQRVLANKFSVSRATISLILKHKRYAALPLVN